MKIPKHFNLGGETINVIYDKELMNRSDAKGETHFRFNEIKIDPTRSKDMICQTMCHELTHLIIDKIGEKFTDEEKFVKAFSVLLYQFIKETQ